MARRAITIRANSEAAQFYEAASAEERCKLDALLSLELVEVTKGELSLEDVMQDISQRAEARALTLDMPQALIDSNSA